VVAGIGLIYYFGPDADQDWVWTTPGAIAAAILWLVISLLFKLYVANFTDYEGSYGTVGGVIVVLLWFYVSGIAILTGAELNAEIEHASPYGKAPGQKNAQGKLLIGARAERAFRQRPLSGDVVPEHAALSIAPSTAKHDARSFTAEVAARSTGALQRIGIVTVVAAVAFAFAAGTKRRRLRSFRHD
jgi:hypothetical protein